MVHDQKDHNIMGGADIIPIMKIQSYALPTISVNLRLEEGGFR
jgi:hypothetical protein